MHIATNAKIRPHEVKFVSFIVHLDEVKENLISSVLFPYLKVELASAQ